MDKSKICAIIGEGPEHFPFPIHYSSPQYILFCRELAKALAAQVRAGCDTFITGMASGFELMAADTLVEMRSHSRRFSRLKLVCTMLFQHDEFYEPEALEARDHFLLRYAGRLLCCAKPPSRAARFLRRAQEGGLDITLFDYASGSNSGSSSGSLSAAGTGASVL